MPEAVHAFRRADSLPAAGLCDQVVVGGGATDREDGRLGHSNFLDDHASGASELTADQVEYRNEQKH